jgi:hypothetical protein
MLSFILAGKASAFFLNAKDYEEYRIKDATARKPE